MILLFLKADGQDRERWRDALASCGRPATVVAAWELAATLAEGLDHVTPMDAAMFEFQRMDQDPGPSVLSPAIRELFAAAELIVNDHADPGSVWQANAERFAPHASFSLPRPGDDLTTLLGT